MDRIDVACRLMSARWCLIRCCGNEVFKVFDALLLLTKPRGGHVDSSANRFLCLVDIDVGAGFIDCIVQTIIQA